MKKNRIDHSAFAFFTEVNIISQLSQNAMDRILPDGLRMAQFGVLNHFVRCGGPQSPSRLANAFQVTKGAMTNTLKRLQKRGLVTITADPADGRSKLVALTGEGTAAHARALEAAGPLMEKLLEPFSPGELQGVLPFLSRLRAQLDQARSEADST